MNLSWIFLPQPAHSCGPVCPDVAILTCRQHIIIQFQLQVVSTAPVLSSSSPSGRRASTGLSQRPPPYIAPSSSSRPPAGGPVGHILASSERAAIMKFYQFDHMSRRNKNVMVEMASDVHSERLLTKHTYNCSTLRYLALKRVSPIFGMFLSCVLCNTL
jgi:hypothetical protein